MADPIYISELPSKLGTNVNDTDIYMVASQDGTNNYKIAQSELQKAFSSLTARNSSGLFLNYNDGSKGVAVSGYGFVGINNYTPLLSLDIKDNASAPNGSGQIKISTTSSGRKIGFGLADPNVYYAFEKEPNDLKLYLEYSSNSGASFSRYACFDPSGNFGLTTGTGSLSYKFFVTGGSVSFQNNNNGFIFDPANTEFKTSATDEILYLNYSNLADVNLGYNGIYLSNSSTNPKVGIGHAAPLYALHVSGSGQVSRYQSVTTQVAASLKNTSNTCYYGTDTNKYFVGAAIGTDNCLIYDFSNKYLGLNTGSPAYAVHALSYNQTAANFSAANNASGPQSVEIVVSANKPLTGGDTGPRNSALTLSRYQSSIDTPKWSASNMYGLFGSNTYADHFALIKNGIFGASPVIELTLDTNGNLDVQGQYTTNSNYCKGKFVQTHKTRLTGNTIYVDPYGTNGSSTSPSGNSDTDSPFSITQYSGKVQKISVMTSKYTYPNPYGNTPTWPAYIEVYATTPSNNSTDNYTPIAATGGVVPPTVVGDLKGYGTFSLAGGNNSIQIVSLNGSNTFSSGQLLQYRIYDSSKKPLGIPVTITSSITEYIS